MIKVGQVTTLATTSIQYYVPNDQARDFLKMLRSAHNEIHYDLACELAEGSVSLVWPDPPILTNRNATTLVCYLAQSKTVIGLISLQIATTVRTKPFTF